MAFKCSMHPPKHMVAFRKLFLTMMCLCAFYMPEVALSGLIKRTTSALRSKIIKNVLHRCAKL